LALSPEFFVPWCRLLQASPKLFVPHRKLTMPHAKLMMPLCKSDRSRGIFNMAWGRCHFWRGIVNLDEGIVHFWRGINNFAWGIVNVHWGIVDIEKGISVVEESPFHSAEGAEKPAEPAKNKGVVGLGFDDSPGVAGAALRLATNASERSTESEKEAAKPRTRVRPAGSVRKPSGRRGRRLQLPHPPFSSSSNCSNPSTSTRQISAACLPAVPTYLGGQSPNLPLC
jgi:hypothetical protein